MANKIYISGNSLIVEDVQESKRKKSALKSEIYYKVDNMEEGSFVKFVRFDKATMSYQDWFNAALSDCVDSEGDQFTKASFYNFCDYNLGTLETLSSTSSNLFSTVGSVKDLPSPENGVITLKTGASYFFTKNVDLEGSKLTANGKVSLFSSSPEIGQISSTGLSNTEYLITSEFNISLNNIGIRHTKCLNLDATAQSNQALDWFGVNFYDCTIEIGIVKNYTNFIANTIGFFNSGNLTFDGTIGTIGINNSIMENASGLTSIIIPSTCEITRRLRVSYSAFISLSGETAINVSETATIPNRGYILDTVNFSGGGTYIEGVQHTDNKADFINCDGINNTSHVGHYYMRDNTIETVITSVDTPVKILGTTISGSEVQGFDVTSVNNRAIYTGSLTQDFKIVHTASLSAGNTQTLYLYNAKNGKELDQSRTSSTTASNNRAENMTSFDVVSLSQGDYIEGWCAQGSNSSNITCENLVTVITLVP